MTFHQKLSFPKDFIEIYELFNKMITKDKEVLNSVEEKHKKKGYFSPAVRILITKYVEENKEGFFRKYGLKEEVEGIVNELPQS